MICKEKTATEILERAKFVASAVAVMSMEDDNSVENWLAARHGDLLEWPFFATVACAFLALEAEESSFEGDDFRELAAEIKNCLRDWDAKGPEAFYELADFVITSEENGVGFISACGLWVVWKVMRETPNAEDVESGYRIGELFSEALSRAK